MAIITVKTKTPAEVVASMSPEERAEIQALADGSHPTYSRKRPSFTSMSQSDLWAEYCKIWKAKGQESASEFYAKHIKPRLRG